MTTYTAVPIFTVCSIAVIGLVVGMLVEALRNRQVRADAPDALTHTAGVQDTALLNYLDHSECNLFFNPQLGAWGLLDGKDKMIATGHNLRTTLARAILKDKGDAANG